MEKGDSIQRRYTFNTGTEILEGKIIQVDIKEKIKPKKWVRIAVNGDLNYIVLSPANKCKKINKNFKLHKEGRMSLF